ncbi:MAG: CrcB family protein [Leptothrix sp. (in: b-proteobacteria)]
MSPGAMQALAVAVGAMLGALLRWQAGARLGQVAGWPVGTLAVNLGGGLLIGVALAWFKLHPDQTLLRLLAVTGFLGGLTTFSAFSGESLNFLLSGRPLAALLHTSAHVLGALAMAALGHALGRAWFG